MAKPAKQVRRRKGNVISVDFTGVKSGGATVPEGRYTAKIVEVEQKEGKESGEPYVQLSWEITSKKCNGRTVPFDNYSLQPQALWRLKGMLEAMEVEVPDGEHEVDFDEMIADETECIVEISHEAGEEAGRMYARVTGHAPLSDGGTVDDDPDEEAEKPSRRKPKDEEEDRPARRRAKDEDEDEPPTRRRAAKDEDEDEDDDEPPTNKKVKKGAKVKFKDEKNKLTKGTIDSIDGDTATVVTADDDTYEIEIDELTVIG